MSKIGASASRAWRGAALALAISLLLGCSGDGGLPLSMKIRKIEVYAIAAGDKITALRTIDDAAAIEAIVEELARLRKTAFEDPEGPANLYEIRFVNGKKSAVFTLADRYEFVSKIYSRASARKGKAWKATGGLMEKLLGDKRLPRKE
ncbi:hypothetical protein ACFPPD_17555 [Cohnella suwonensis]|uniref:Lipoprotein n=1 Tax=Cohnella suwonensis TaxID=696072 RepID=A0ABW0LYX8_9BACL